tara:strand:+ start:70 stop:420 length:351 start_codon:yes stop_codon:yes gene_type:complete
MAKKQINYSDLSTKELELLKDTYINLKVKSMSNNDLKDFAIENISFQIKNTIGNDEELEAWQEMEEFFKEDFDNTIRDIQIMMSSKKGEQTTLNTKEIKPKFEEKEEDKKLDMWED